MYAVVLDPIRCGIILIKSFTGLHFEGKGAPPTAGEVDSRAWPTTGRERQRMAGESHVIAKQHASCSR